MYCIPCYMFGLNARAVGDHCGVCSCVFWNPFARMYIRGKIREKESIDVSQMEPLYSIYSYTVI